MGGSPLFSRNCRHSSANPKPHVRQSEPGVGSGAETGFRGAKSEWSAIAHVGHTTAAIWRHTTRTDQESFKQGRTEVERAVLQLEARHEVVQHLDALRKKVKGRRDESQCAVAVRTEGSAPNQRKARDGTVSCQ